VVQAAVADIIGPAVASDDPHALAHQGVRHGEQITDLRGVGQLPQAGFQPSHPLPLRPDPLLCGLIGVQQFLHQGLADLGAEPLEKLLRVFPLLI